MGVWSEKVVPIIHKFFGKDAAAEQACKSFDESKDAINKEFEEKKGVLKSKVLEIYEASSTEIRSLVKEPKEHGLKKHSVKVQTFLDELVKIDFPGSKAAYEAATKYGLPSAAGPTIFVFEKVSIFIVNEEPKSAPKPQHPAATSSREITVETPTTTSVKETPTITKEPPTTTTKETPTTTANKEVVVEKADVKESPKVEAKKEEPLKKA